jgi:hypothetical protein
MRHARLDYDRIQDPADKIPFDEPVFLLRGQDRLAYLAVLYYAGLVRAAGGDPEIARLSEEWALEMAQWPHKKLPDLPPPPPPPPPPPLWMRREGDDEIPF